MPDLHVTIGKFLSLGEKINLEAESQRGQSDEADRQATIFGSTAWQQK
jgi:hypothetical protein